MQPVQVPQSGWMERFVDGFVGLFSPQAAAERLAYRAAQYDLQAALSRGARHSRLDRSAPTRGVTANRALFTERLDHVARARQLEQNSAVFSSLLDRDADNVIGVGMRPQAQSASTAWNKRAEDLFKEWGEDQADCRGMDSFGEMQRLLYRSRKRDGDAGWLFLGDGSLRLTESEEIASPPGREAGPNMVEGVELDRRGRPQAFWLVDETDSAQLNPGYRTGTGRVRVSADDFVFYPRRQRAGQTRGVPVSSTTSWLYDALDQHIEAALAASRLAASLGLIWQKKTRQTGLEQRQDEDGNTYGQMKVGAASILRIALGEDVKQLNPGQPVQQLPELIRLVARLLGLPFHFPLELVFLDFSTGNYAQARGVLLQAWQAWRVEQDLFKRRVLRPTWKRKVRDFIRDGKLRDRSDWDRHIWIAPGWQWIDPSNELDANLLAVDACFDTVTDILGRMGRDFSEILEVRKRELADMKKAGIDVVKSLKTRDPIAVSTPDENAPEGEKQADEAEETP